MLHPTEVYARLEAEARESSAADRKQTLFLDSCGLGRRSADGSPADQGYRGSNSRLGDPPVGVDADRIRRGDEETAGGPNLLCAHRFRTGPLTRLPPSSPERAPARRAGALAGTPHRGEASRGAGVRHQRTLDRTILPALREGRRPGSGPLLAGGRLRSADRGV